MYQQIAANKRRTILLIAAFVALVMALGYAFATLSSAGYPILGVALAFALITTGGSWWAGDRLALATAGAKPLLPANDPELHRLVENLAITAGLPMPKLYIIPDASLNAFATGRDPRHASIAVTAGLRQSLTKSELEGVLAHELSHVQNYDTRYLMVTIILVGFVALAADFFLRFQLFGFGERRRQHGVLLFVGLALAILAPLAAKLLQLAISRRREFLADASGVLLTRYPAGLSAALKKIAAAEQPTRSANRATAPLYFAQPLKTKGASRGIGRFFATHPPITERIAALENMA